MDRSSIECHEPKTQEITLTIANAMSQSQFEVNTYMWCQARENACTEVFTIALRLLLIGSKSGAILLTNVIH